MTFRTSSAGLRQFKNAPPWSAPTTLASQINAGSAGMTEEAKKILFGQGRRQKSEVTGSSRSNSSRRLEAGGHVNEASMVRRRFFLVGFAAGAAHAAEAPLKFLLAYGAIGGNADAAVDRQRARHLSQIQSRAAVDLHHRRAGDAVDDRGRYSVRLARRDSHVTNAVTAGGDMTMLLGMEDKLNYFLNVRPGSRAPKI